jgi:L-seryl-tRNA(Ser) seleniumtransferase
MAAHMAGSGRHAVSLDSTSPQPADIPSLDRLLHDDAFCELLAHYARSLVISALRKELETLRHCALGGVLSAGDLKAGAIAGRVGAELVQRSRPRLRPLFNLTGTVLHTNFGRAPLSEAAVQSLLRTLTAPVNLEFDLQSGSRGDRDDLLEPLICQLTGAEAATLVNNNAAAVLLMLNTLANRRQVIVSRGELVEIGGAFRIPDVMRSAGATLVEVGTTNRTHASDYTQAIGAKTALLMKVHTSNYVLTGFTASVNLADLAAIGRDRGVPVAVDLGSGSLVDLQHWGLPREPTVRDALSAGADLVTFSGDKLLGGPQAGIIVGRREWIQRLKKNPLKRALRLGRLTLAALEPMLDLYRSPELLAERLPTLRLLVRSAAEIEAQTLRVLPAVQTALGEEFVAAPAAMMSQIGSGALPVDRLPSFGLCVRKGAAKRGSLARLERTLRECPRPIIGRMADKALWLDLRCLEAADEPEFTAQWQGLNA